MLAQTILVLPIAIALSRQVFETLNTEYAPLFRSIGLGHARWVAALVTEARISLITIGPYASGGPFPKWVWYDCRWQHPPFDTCNDNIDRTRHINGRVTLAVALGIVLLMVALLINIATQLLRGRLQDSGHDL